MNPNGTGAKGEQDVGTPPELLDAIRERFGPLHIDLAATVDNAVCTDFISPRQDSLKADWPGFDLYTGRGIPAGAPINLWLNPPFADIKSWAAKCAAWKDGPVHPQSRLFLLVPASVGTNWWTQYVSGIARVIPLAPRLTFVGHKNPFPKEMCLCVYEPCWKEQPRMEVTWRWDGKEAG